MEIMLGNLLSLAFACGLMVGLLLSLLIYHIIKTSVNLKKSKISLLCPDCQKKYYKLFGKSFI